MQSQGNTIFVGIKINERLRDQLDSSTTSKKPFFEANDPAFLQVLQIDAEEYIGKVIESGTSLEILSNLLMNVKTMLKMICPTFTPAEGAIKIFALTPTPARAVLA
jgi:hypothetical protein